MKTLTIISAWVLLLLLTPSSCFALWQLEPVNKKRASKMGMEVRSTPAGPNHVRVELEFPTDGKLKDFSHVDLHFGQGDNPPLTAALKEDHSKPGRVVVSFSADRTQLGKIKLWVMVPFTRGGNAYELQMKNFVEPVEEP